MGGKGYLHLGAVSLVFVHGIRRPSFVVVCLLVCLFFRRLQDNNFMGAVWLFMAALASCKTKDRYSMAYYMKSEMSNLYIYEGGAVHIAGKNAVSNDCAIALYGVLTSASRPALFRSTSRFSPLRIRS